MKHALILARVSTRDQEQDGQSILAQLHKLREIALQRGYEVIKEYVIVESSTQGERKEFNEMIAFIKAQKESVILLADCVDRVQRSFKESILLHELTNQDKLEILFAREGLHIHKNSGSNELIQWDYATLGARSYVLNLSSNVRRTNDFKRHNGDWTGRAPVGYMSVREGQNRYRDLVPDSERDFLVKRCFELYATGQYSLQKLAQQMKVDGLTGNFTGKPLKTNQIHNLIKNPFYMGIMSTMGQMIPHKYKPLVDEWLFRKCEQVRLGYKKKPFKYAGKQFAFKGVARCGHCGRGLSSYTQKSQFTYLRCTSFGTNCVTKQVTEIELLGQMSEYFKQLEIPEHVMSDLHEKLKSGHEAKKNYHNELVKGLHEKDLVIQQKLDRLMDMRLEQSITSSQYDKKAKELKDDQQEIAIRLIQATKADKDYASTVSYLLNLSSRAHEIFMSSQPAEKNQLIKFVVANLIVTNEKVDITLKKPFDAIYSANIHSNWLPLLDSLRTEMDEEIIQFAEHLKQLQSQYQYQFLHLPTE